MSKKDINPILMKRIDFAVNKFYHSWIDFNINFSVQICILRIFDYQTEMREEICSISIEYKNKFTQRENSFKFLLFSSSSSCWQLQFKIKAVISSKWKYVNINQSHETYSKENFSSFRLYLSLGYDLPISIIKWLFLNTLLRLNL